MHHRLPPAAVWSAAATSSVALHTSRQIDLITHANWAQILLPQIGRNDLFQRFDQSVPIGAEVNAPGRTSTVEAMNCPADPFNYAGNHYAFAMKPGDPKPLLFARGNYAINGGTHNYQTDPPTTANSRGDHAHLRMQSEPRRFELWGNGVAGINRSFAREDFQNGESTLIALEEVRAGLHSVDPRGVWALGQIGGSITWGHGIGGDDYAPNHSWPRADDVRGCGELHEILGAEAIQAAGMPCVHYVDINQQATSRSLHPGGVHVACLDGAARFVSDDIDPSLWHVLHSRETPRDRVAGWSDAGGGMTHELPADDVPLQTAATPSLTSAQSHSGQFENSIGLRLIRITPGEFSMGVPDLGNDDKPPAETPAHPVRLTAPFFISAYEVTRGQFAAVMGETHPGRQVPDNPADFPVTDVTWDEATEFCQRLSAQEPGIKYRLPTEAEWEFCCRAGSSRPYDWAARRYRTAGDTSGESAGILPPLPITAVGSYPPNAWGLYDLRGNAWEWTADWFARDYYARSPVVDPRGPASGWLKVVRGGNWRFIGEICRIDYPMLPPWKSNPVVGFRVAAQVND